MTQSSAHVPQAAHAADKKPSSTPGAASSTSRGGAVQLRANLQGRDFAAQEAMLRPPPVQKKKRGASEGATDKGDVQLRAAVQREGEKKDATALATVPAADAAAAKIPPQISYTVPPVVDVASIANPVSRNQAINQSYHQFDTAMTAYLGEPLVSNWCTYGQHASREAGAQIKNLQAAKGLISDIGAHLADFQSATLSASTPWGFIDAIRSAWSIARRAWNDVKIVIGLLGEEGLVKQSVLLWLSRAGITQDELNDISSRFGAIAGMDITDVGLGTAREVYNLIVDTVNIGIRLATGIPGLLTALTLIYDNMCKGNREIYENVAPAYASFLASGLAASNGVVGSMGFGGDSRGFLGAAFALYSQVRDKSNQIAVAPADDPTRGTNISQRTNLAHRANLLVGYQEQLVILQPIFDTMGPELAAMSGTMVLRDPNGAHPLTGNWQDFYTRMGLDPAKTPPLSQINASNLGELAARGRREGTISAYFEDYVTDKKVHGAPSKITPHGS